MNEVKTFFKEARTSKRRKGVSPKVRAEVLRRSQGHCEARIGEICTGDYEHAHHRRRRSQGGADSAANLLAVCRECHRHIHANPAWSEAQGFLLRSSFTAAPGLVKVEKVQR